MSDIFISYAHEDQPFARRMASALEMDGFSVWWDHTIPPGQTWDTFIARGIEEARACIVIWSKNSIASDWVKEEATLAKDGGKYVPVQIDGSQPPVGFRRVQAADLRGWSGDRSNAQWRLLCDAARGLSGRERTSAYTPAPAPATPSSANRNALLGAIGAGVAVIAALAFFATREKPAPTAEAPAATEYAAPFDSGATAPANSADPAQQAEVERLRQERDQALESARQQVAENERLRQATVQTTAVAPADWVIGAWRRTATTACASVYFWFYYENGVINWKWGDARYDEFGPVTVTRHEAGVYREPSGVSLTLSGSQLIYNGDYNCTFARQDT